MEILIVLLLVILFFVVVFAVTTAKRNKVFQENIERRQKFLETISPNARAIVNNGQHFFFVDDTRRVFGLDESGKVYTYEGLLSIGTYRDCITFMHNDSVSLCVGKNASSYEETFPLDTASVTAIANVMLPILRKKLHNELAVHAITPTFEYEHEGVFWGCDMQSKFFYSTFGCIQIYPFSALNRITVEDMTNNSLYDGSYILRLYIKSDVFDDDDQFDLTFYAMDAKFNSMLTMFKEIRKRRRF